MRRWSLIVGQWASALAVVVCVILSIYSLLAGEVFSFILVLVGSVYFVGMTQVFLAVEDYLQDRDARQKTLGPRNNPAVELVPVLRTDDVGLLAMSRSLLESAEIPHVAQGATGTELFPLHVPGAGPGSGLIETTILVARDRSDEARALLRESRSVSPADAE